MPLGYTHPDSWLREDDEFDRYNRPGSPDWFSLSGDVGFAKPNNRHDAMKVESLLGYGGYLDLEKGGGPLGLSNRKLEEPIKAFQAKNGLKVDGLLKPGGPTIAKMKELYGGVFGKTPAPTPAMIDAHVEQVAAGEEGFLHDKGPAFALKPNRRLDGKAHLMDYERWNRDWARNSGDNPKSLAPEYESYIRDLDKDHGHDPGLIFARDIVRQVGTYHGPENGGELAKRLTTLLSDRPDLQRELLGGPVPTSPPIGTFKDGGEGGVKTWIDQDRIASGLPPKFAKSVVAHASGEASEQRLSARAAPASNTAPDPKNLLEYTQHFGTPEDWALEQQTPQEPDRTNAQQGREQASSSPQTPAPGEGGAGWYDPNQMDPEGSHRRQPPDNSRGFEDEFPHPSQQVPDMPPRQPREPSTGEGGAGWYDPNEMTPLPKPEPPPPPPAPVPERRPHQDKSDAVLGAMTRNAEAGASVAHRNWQEAITRYRLTEDEIRTRKGNMLVDAGKKSGETASNEAAQHLAERAILQSPPRRGIGSVTTRSLTGAAAVGAIIGAAGSISDGSPGLRTLEAERDAWAEKIETYRQIHEEAARHRDELRREKEIRRQGRR